MKKVALFLADGFEEAEAVIPWDLLLRAGADVSTFSVSGIKTVRGAHGIDLTADKLINNCDFNCFDLFLLPGGGTGTKNLNNCVRLTEIISNADKCGKLIGAICAAPTILSTLGLLRDKYAVCYPSMQEELICKSVSDKKTVRDGNIITSSGLGTAVEFGLALVEALYGEEASDSLSKTIVFYK